MNIQTLISRFLLPGIIVTIVGYLKFKCFISPKAEVELSQFLKIGRKSKISSFCKLKATRGPLLIGERVDIATGCFLSSSEKELRIGNDVLIGPNCTILSNNYNARDLYTPIRDQGRKTSGTVIEDNVLVGAGTVILDGSLIGTGSIIAANSLVSGEIPKNSIVSGNPAKVVFTRR